MRDGGEENLAPVIPLFGSRPDANPEGETVGDDEARAQRASMALAEAERVVRERRASSESTAEEAGSGEVRPIRHLRAAGSRVADGEESATAGGHDAVEHDPDRIRVHAEEALVRKLRAKQLSIAEARSVLRENDLDRDSIEMVLDEFEHRGYLDDRTLASLLVTSGVERKGQGRVAISRTLSQRGIPRDIIDEALSELPDDDEERALEFARGKADGMRGLEYDTALRRLLGQLARRGYGGSSAMSAARTALDEAGVTRSGARFTPRTSGRISGVRFTDTE